MDTPHTQTTSYPIGTGESELRYRYVYKKREVLDYIAGKRSLVIDLETTGLNPRTDKITMCALYDGEEALLFPGEIVPVLKEFYGLWIAHNYKFDFAFMFHAGIDLLSRRVRDTILLHHLLHEEAEHSLDSIVKDEFKDNYKEVFWSTYKTFSEASYKEQCEYAVRDVQYTWRLHRKLENDCFEADIPETLIEHVHKLAAALLLTEVEGVCVDYNYLLNLGEKLNSEIEHLKGKIRESASLQIEEVELDLWLNQLQKRRSLKGKENVSKPEFNLDSSRNLGTLLFEKLCLTKQINKKTKGLTTDDAALEALKNEHPVVPLLQEYRGKQKIFTSFIKGTLEKLENGRVYPSFNVNGTVTGRLSSSNPNMQQLPREGNVRGIYVPRKDHVLISCDYSQLEVVLAAHFSGDPILQGVITKGESMHDYTANAIGIKRQDAKTVNFLCIYGGTEYKLGHVLNIHPLKAKKILDKLWETYKGLKSAIDDCHSKVDKGIPIVNPFGRQRHFDITGKNRNEIDRMKRQAFNALIQGTGADMCNRSFYLIQSKLRELNIGRALFPVHDENVVEAHKDHVEQVKEIVKEAMLSQAKVIGMQIPLAVDCSEALERWTK